MSSKKTTVWDSITNKWKEIGAIAIIATIPLYSTPFKTAILGAVVALALVAIDYFGLGQKKK